MITHCGFKSLQATIMEYNKLSGLGDTEAYFSHFFTVWEVLDHITTTVYFLIKLPSSLHSFICHKEPIMLALISHMGLGLNRCTGSHYCPVLNPNANFYWEHSHPHWPVISWHCIFMIYLFGGDMQSNPPCKCPLLTRSHAYFK